MKGFFKIFLNFSENSEFWVYVSGGVCSNKWKVFLPFIKKQGVDVYDLVPAEMKSKSQRKEEATSKATAEWVQHFLQ